MPFPKPGRPVPYHSCSEEGTPSPVKHRDNHLQPCRPLGNLPVGRETIPKTHHCPTLHRTVLRLNHGSNSPLQINSMQHLWPREITHLSFSQDNPLSKQIHAWILEALEFWFSREAALSLPPLMAFHITHQELNSSTLHSFPGPCSHFRQPRRAWSG